MSADWLTVSIGAVSTAGATLWAGVRCVAKLSKILAEVSPNGGYSLKDRVIKLEGSQSDQTKRLDRIEKLIQHSMDVREARLDKIEDSIHKGIEDSIHRVQKD